MGVTESSKYEAVINDDFDDFADHYDCSAIFTQAYRPRDKALVEGTVKLICRRQHEIPLEEDVLEDKFTLEHKNIREKEYYQ